MRHTELYAKHQALGARLIDFGGWEMPVQYSGIVEEHLAVRRAAGLFDIAHMGEIGVSGSSAARFLNRVLTNDLRRLEVGQGQYSLMCHESGGVVDDLYVYRTGVEEYLLIVNASRVDADEAWLRGALACDAAAGAVRLANRSNELGAIAVQGPAVRRFVDAALAGLGWSQSGGIRASGLKKNEILSGMCGGANAWVACTGYTGEDGYEVVVPGDRLEAVWDAFMAAGAADGIRACGLGARDTLRTEMGYPLYGHELDEHTSPIEAGLGFFVAFDKGPFSGRDVLAAQKSGGVRRRCVAFRMVERSAPPRPGYAVWDPGAPGGAVGTVVSGTQSPSLNVGIGMAYVPPSLAKAGTAIEIEIRGRRYRAEVAAKPLYKRPV